MSQNHAIISRYACSIGQASGMLGTDGIFLTDGTLLTGGTSGIFLVILIFGNSIKLLYLFFDYILNIVHMKNIQKIVKNIIILTKQFCLQIPMKTLLT